MKRDEWPIGIHSAAASEQGGEKIVQVLRRVTCSGAGAIAKEQQT